MLTPEARETTGAKWLAHWQGLEIYGCGRSISIQWTLRRAGQWIKAPAAPAAPAELEIGGVAQLGQVIDALERAA